MDSTAGRRPASAAHQAPVPEPIKRRGRRPGGEDTRRAIVDAARQVFAASGYDGATMRAVARAAGVDPRLVRHYFADKEALFAAAVDLPSVPSQQLERLRSVPPPERGALIVRVFLGIWDPAPEAMMAAAQLVFTGPRSMFAQFVRREVVQGIATLARDDDRELRAGLIASHLIGMAMARYAVAIEPLASADAEDLVAIVGPTVQRYLDGDL